MAQYINPTAYGLSQAILPQSPIPIVAQRAPTANDLGYPVGQLWVNEPAATAYVLTSVVAHAATWVQIQAGGGGGAGVFTTLTSTGQVNLNTTTVGAMNVIGNNNGATGVTLESGTGGITLASFQGAITLTSVNSPIEIGTDPNAKVIVIGNATGNTGVAVDVGTGDANFGTTATDHSTGIGSLLGVSSTTINSGTAGILLNGAFVELPGDVHIYTGAGAPGNGLALTVGDLYINTTAASATTRLYIATAASTWTNVTCAA